MITKRSKAMTSVGACALVVLGGIACSSGGPGEDAVDQAGDEAPYVDQDTQALSDPTGLVGKWRFNEGAGQRVRDASGNGIDGRRGSDPFAADVNDPAWIAISPGQSTPLEVPPYALRFQSASPDWVRVGSGQENFSRLERQRISVEAWVRSNSSQGGTAYIVAKGANGCNSASYALYNDNSGVKFYVTGLNGNFHESPAKAGSAVWDGAWHHLVGTYDGASVRLYVDGVQVGNGTPFDGTIKYDLSTNDHLFFGRYGNAACVLPFQGLIDDVRIYRQALDGAEVAQRASGLVTPDADGDHVVNTSDKCPSTAVGAPANLRGCSVAQCCPTSAPRTLPDGACPKETSATSWRNHGAYVSCVSAIADQLLNQGEISIAQRDTYKRNAAQSDVGK